MVCKRNVTTETLHLTGSGSAKRVVFKRALASEGRTCAARSSSLQRTPPEEIHREKFTFAIVKRRSPRARGHPHALPDPA
jgi:hypothetical protein